MEKVESGRKGSEVDGGKGSTEGRREMKGCTRLQTKGKNGL